MFHVAAVDTIDTESLLPARTVHLLDPYARLACSAEQTDLMMERRIKMKIELLTAADGDRASD